MYRLFLQDRSVRTGIAVLFGIERVRIDAVRKLMFEKRGIAEGLEGKLTDR